MLQTELESAALIQALKQLGVPDELASSVPMLPRDSSGVLVYGSRARQDAVPDSDLDILVLVEKARPGVVTDNVSLSHYTADELDSGVGTLFGAHLGRDAKVLWDPSGSLAALLSRMGAVDTRRLFERSRHMSQILGSLEADLPKYLPGLLREARYLLRSCLYANAIAAGEPCFSVREIAERNQDAKLVDLLASRHAGPATRVDLDACIERLEVILGRLPANPHGSLEALIVNEWEEGGDVLSMGFMALGATGATDYAEVGKILL